MDNQAGFTICFSHYFTNKQNVRSIENVLNLKLLKKRSEEEYFFGVLEDKSLVSEISNEFKDVLLSLRTNVRNISKDDFKSYFIQNEEQSQSKSNNIISVKKGEIFAQCWKALYDVIPKDIYGSPRNMMLFKDLVRVVLFSMKNQHIFLSKFIFDWDLKMHPWNTLSLQRVRVQQILSKILLWILKNILSGILCLNFFVTTTKVDTDENKLHFFWKNQWQSFYDRKISDLIFSKMMSKFEPNCLGKTVKRKYSPQEKLQFKVVKKEIPKLHLILKPNNYFRPIVRYRNDALTSVLKNKIKEKLNFLKALTGKQQEKIETKYSSFYSEWVDRKKPRLYFVKTDLSNAFGSINREKLKRILAEKHLDFQKMNQPFYLKKRFAQIYRDIIVELRKPLLVRAGSTVYEWKEGLVQGYKYSPALSELYYTHMDKIYFSDLLKKQDNHLKLFVRVVDDYLYITDSFDDAQLFLTALSNYRNVNYEKTFVNFPHPTIKSSEDITFLGYSYNTKTLEVKRASNIFTGPMCYKISFSNAISDVGKFLDNRIGQSGIQINSHLFNLNYNSEDLIWKHIFLTLCLSANKFCTILGILCDAKEMHRYLDLYKKRVTVKLCNSMIYTLKHNKPEDFLFVYCINHFRYLSFKALSLCAKKTPNCNGLVPIINIELCKTNCIFGKFREHSSRIDSHGKSVYPARKEVCRRTDLRKIMKLFEVLPSGFECYNHRRFFM